MALLDLRKAPFPITPRELYLPRTINGVTLPSARSGGNALNLTGALKGATTDGVHFPFAELFISNTQHYNFIYNCVSGDFTWQKVCGGGSSLAHFEYNPAIDDYAIIIMTHQDGTLNLYVNGTLADSGTWTPVMPSTLAQIFLGCEDTPSMYDVSKPIYFGFHEGAFSQKQALDFSCFLNDAFGMGLRL